MTEELFKEATYSKTADAKVCRVMDEGVILDRTIFYPEGGGQPGDMGSFRLQDGQDLNVTNTVKTPNGILHILNANKGEMIVGQGVTMNIDWERRFRHMRMHTALHLLCSQVEGAVTGGAIGAQKSRLDFNIPGERPEKEELEEKMNTLIADDHELSISWITDEELEANPDLVRTMSVKPPMGTGRIRMVRIGENIDFQPCGGTHVKSTREIGAIKIGKIENKGRQNRRINILLSD
jgi:misacylated tRNA(Ala) deacylase|tara:strand:+ start:193 stop:900 length:708 start_codon:yes stop_codon:yes gene_type:complete